MSGCTGIIAEYNPFHNGHLYQLSRARELSGARAVAIAMSGSFTQRGEPACTDKFTRAKWALANGADIVFELPAVFALANAERFAKGGVALLGMSGIVDALSFGAENADLGILRQLAVMSAVEGDLLKQRLDFHLSAGKSFPAARACACADVHGNEELSAAFLSPNNILGCEYIKAIDAAFPTMRPIPVARLGAAHDAPHASGRFASASALREALDSCDMTFFRAGVPEDVYLDARQLIIDLRTPCKTAALSDVFIYALRKLQPVQLERLPDVIEGLENAIYREARRCTNYGELLAAIKSKRYTAARLRRILACALLGITKDMVCSFPVPLYLRVLGVRKESANLLSQLAQSSCLPVVTGKSDYDALSDEAKAMLDIDLLAGELLSMAAPAPYPPEYEFAHPLMMI
jgi:predicted nucleotidyltransferase